MATATQERADVYTRVTQQIISALEAGAGDWKMPWHGSDHDLRLPHNIATGKPYRGVNILTLWCSSFEHGFSEPVWGTYKQWSDLGHQVQKGSRASIGVFWKRIDADQPALDQGEESAVGEGRRLVARAFGLFNANQVEGYVAPERPDLPPIERIERAEAFFASLRADIRNGGGRAYYNPHTDHIQMPAFEAFADPIAYYATLGHEATHWTGARCRLNRDLSGRFGSESYAAEELIAELGSAFLGADLQLTPEPREDHAAYIQSWLKILRADKRAIFTAAGHAQRAADYLNGQIPVPTPASERETCQPIALTL